VFSCNSDVRIGNLFVAIRGGWLIDKTREIYFLLHHCWSWKFVHAGKYVLHVDRTLLYNFHGYKLYTTAVLVGFYTVLLYCNGFNSLLKFLVVYLSFFREVSLNIDPVIRD